jgi:F0F1-type ATP synthase assembly protein I
MAGEDRKSTADGNGQPPRKKKRPGEIYRESSLLAAPTIIIVYPLVGFFLGWLTVRYWSWPDWVMLLTTLGGVVEGIREVYRLSKKIERGGSDKADKT